MQLFNETGNPRMTHQGNHPVGTGGGRGGRTPRPQLVHASASPDQGQDAIEPDESQRAAISAARTHPVTLITGAPGTGKTTTALSLATEILADPDVDAADVLVLAATRRGAGSMRNDLAALAGRTVNQPLVRTAASIAFSILERYAAGLEKPAPTLISGPEQDLLLAELLAGHLEDFAEGRGRLTLPPGVPLEVLGTRGFRDELRDVFMRAAERGLDPVALDHLGRANARPAWCLAAQLFEEYRDVTVLRQGTPDSGSRYDPAVVLDAALNALTDWEEDLQGLPRPRWAHVIVDDYQEATAALARFLHFLIEDGASVTLFGDPDAAVQTFRGAVPRLIASAVAPSRSGHAGEFDAHQVSLDRVWRHSAQMRDVTARVAQHVGTVGTVQHRRAGAAGEVGAVEAAVLLSPAEEHAFIAGRLRAHRLFDGVPWSRMAVLARSGSQVADLRRSLASASVPVSVLGSEGALRDEPAVRPLLVGLEAIADGGLDPEGAAGLLLSPLGGFDAVTLRRLRRALRTEELAGGGGRSSDALLVELLTDPSHTETLPASVRHGAHTLARILAKGRDALQESNANPQTVLWAIWDASGLADRWRVAALNGGPRGVRADSDLDAVLALFKAAERFVERTHHAQVGQFIEYVRSQELPADSLAARGGDREAVSVLTPASAAGREWDVVVVAGVQEGVWPDLRLRDSLLGAQALVEVEAAREAGQETDARRLVLADEVRAFLVATSRARTNLLVTAVQDTESVPSVLLDLVQEPLAATGPDEDERDPRVRRVAPALDLRGLIGTTRHQLRASVVRDQARDTEPSTRSQGLAALLAKLARAGLGPAHPDTWYHVNPITSTDPVWTPEQQVRVSPSKIELVTTCPLRWALEAAGGRASEAMSQSLGNLIHSIAEELPVADEPTLMARLDRRWDELGLRPGWPAVVTRRNAQEMIRKLANHFAKSGEVLAVEAEFKVDLGQAILSGKVDRLVLDSGGVMIEDLKTGSGLPTAAKTGSNAQLGTYQLAFEEGAFREVPTGASCAGAALVGVGTPTKSVTVRKQSPLSESDDPQWAKALVESAVETMAQAQFLAQINDNCRNCPVRRSCPLQSEGRQVSSGPSSMIGVVPTAGPSPFGKDAE